MKRIFLIFSILFFSILSLGNLFARELEETFKKTIPVKGATLLTLENRNGDIEIRSWDNEEVQIVAYKKVRANNLEQAEELMEHLVIDIREHSDEIEVITEYPDRGRGKDGGFFSWLMGDWGNSGYSVHYEVLVPAKFDLNLESTNGRIEVVNCQGRMRLNTTNGKIIAEDIKGSIRCKTTNGSIKASFLKVEEDDEMSFSSTNGSIRLYLPGEINAEIKAKTTNGSINCDLPIRERYGRSKKSLEAVINDGGMYIYLNTTNGSIHIQES